jgi:hypothetical protein
MRLVRRVLVASMGVAASLVVAASGAVAAPPETSTVNLHGLEETFVDVFPSCEDGAPYEVTTVTNLVEHETVFDDGRVHATFTQTGTFEATPLEDPSLPDASGRFTVWGGFNANGKTHNGTFTFSVRGSTEDGERIQFHFTEHFNERPDGTVNEFFHCHD